MKVLFVLHLFSQSRHYHTVFEELLSRGHGLKVLGLHNVNHRDNPVKIPKHARHIRGVAYDNTAPPRKDFWRRFAEPIRASRNLLLYNHPDMKNATVFRRRAESVADPFLNSIGPKTGDPAPEWLRRAYAAAEAAIPAPTEIIDQIKLENPDVILVSPLIFNNMLSMTDYVKAANILGVPIGFPVFSWDNLTTKGTLLEMPDRIFVWNNIQRREAIDLHGVPENKIETLGAWRFDDMKDFETRLSYEAFCNRNGFDREARTIFYIGSSPIVASTESEFVDQWVDAVRNADDPQLRNANILIRPHPRNTLAWWDAMSANAYPRVNIQMLNELSLFETRDLYESIYHSHAVVGLVTSAMIEAAIFKKPVHTIITRLAGEGQEGTVHFDYLTSAGGGLLYVARSIDEHLAAITPHMQQTPGNADPNAEQFLAAFVAPPDGGSSTGKFVDAIERLGAMRKKPRGRGIRSRLIEQLLKTALASGALPVGRRGGQSASTSADFNTKA